MEAVDVEVFGGGGRHVAVRVADIVCISKRTDLDEREPPTEIRMDYGSLIVTDGMRTIAARAGYEARFREVAGIGGGWPTTVAIGRITHLTKRDETRDDDEDVTLVHLDDGGCVPTSDSIRTLSAVLGLAGIPTVDVDVIGTDRPACVVPDHVMSGIERESEGDEREFVLVMAGGKALVVRDAAESLLRPEGGRPSP